MQLYSHIVFEIIQKHAENFNKLIQILFRTIILFLLPLMLCKFWSQPFRLLENVANKLIIRTNELIFSFTYTYIFIIDCIKYSQVCKFVNLNPSNTNRICQTLTLVVLLSVLDGSVIEEFYTDVYSSYIVANGCTFKQ